MNMKKAYFVSAALLMSAAVSFGQNFNPTVEVTNTYQGSPSEVQKPLLGMNVPDSLLRFDPILTMRFSTSLIREPTTSSLTCWT